MDSLHLYAAVPIAGFRVAQAREYWETYPCPPPATVYGMLLALVGEQNRLVHRGAQVAVAMLAQPPVSTILRTLWRVKSFEFGPGQGSNKRPDFQELLTDVRVSIWLRAGNDQEQPTLLERVDNAMRSPTTIIRYGGLSLGESTCLVNEIRPWRKTDPSKGDLLETTDHGDLSLPVWPDHVGSRGTRWAQYRLTTVPISEKPPDSAWTEILPP
jgi:CRISPR-associated protein Cas5t